MKNILAGIILIVGWGMIANTPVFAAPLAKPEVETRPIEVVVNGEFIKLDIHPLMDRHHLFIPIRALASLGLSYSFNAKTKMTTVQFKTLGTSDGHRLHSYTFPIGRADVYYLLDGMFTFVKIKKGQAIAIGQLFRERRVPSIAAGNISPDMSLDTDPIMEPYNHGNVLFTEYEDGTAKAIYTDKTGHFIEKKMKMDIYSDLIQKLPDQ